ncbi:hypothetical protein [Archangium sp.]|uniref:hypothetical protein n=1 Tax=Archangium sp. TaxID=1872627 RepID=UPI00286A2F4F|nr:hypothetical protein [Archangium sp.]
MISPELAARIRRLHFAEHWKVGTICSELGVHHDTVRRALRATRTSSFKSWRAGMNNAHW